MTAAANKSMDVRAKQRLSYQTGLFNSELCGGGFAPRHLNRSAFHGKINGLLFETIKSNDAFS